MFYVFIFVFSFFFIDTPMEVVSPGGMFVYTAVYMLAADGAVFDTPEKSMVRGTPKRKPRYLFSRFMFFIFVRDTYQVRTYNKGQHPNHKKKTRDTCIQQCTRLLLMGM